MCQHQGDSLRQTRNRHTYKHSLRLRPQWCLPHLHDYEPHTKALGYYEAPVTVSPSSNCCSKQYALHDTNLHLQEILFIMLSRDWTSLQVYSPQHTAVSCQVYIEKYGMNVALELLTEAVVRDSTYSSSRQVDVGT